MPTSIGTSRTRPLNVLVKLNSLELGGTQLIALDFALAAHEHGINTTLVGHHAPGPRQPSTLVDLARERGLHIEVLQQPPGTANQGQIAELSDLADRHDIDLVHSYGSWEARSAFLGPCRLGRRPLVMTVYEMWLPDVVYRLPQLIVGTRELFEDLQDTRGNVSLISPPVDLLRDDGAAVDSTGFARDLGIDEGNVLVVVVTRLDDHMKAFGVETAIRAFERLGRRDANLVVVGTGGAEERLRAEGAAVNARLGRAAVTFTGAMTDPRRAYAAADIVLGQGASAARALSFAKPLVAYGELGWSETFTPENAQRQFRTSFWSPHPADQPETLLLDQLRPLLDRRDEREQLGTFGRSFAAANFGLAEMVGKLVSVYDAAMADYGMTPWLDDWHALTEAR